MDISESGKYHIRAEKVSLSMYWENKEINRKERLMKKKSYRLTVLRLLLICACLMCAGMFFGSEKQSQAKKKWYKIEGEWVGFDKKTGVLSWAPISYVPKKIAGTKVKVIGKWAFSGNKKIVTAVIPSSVKRIDKGAFNACPKLKKVVFPKNFKLGDVKDNSYFWGSNKLETVVNNPDKNWQARIDTFEKAVKYLDMQGPQYFLQNVRSSKNQWIVGPDGKHINLADPEADDEWQVIVNKAQELTSGCTTDREKAEAICTWISKYLHYDTVWMEKFQEWRKTHDENTEVFPLKKVTDAYGLITWDPSEHEGETAMTTCGGYGNLTQALFGAVGIPCVHVWREQKEGERIDHVFNCAYVGGRWIWIDSTYMSDEKLDYFDCAPAGFAASDHRCDDINLDNLDDLIAGQTAPVETNKTDSNSNTEYVRIDGLSWGIDRASNTLKWVPKEWTGTVIPTELDGMTVYAIGDYAVQNHDEIREIIIPEGITSVGEGAFRNCERLSCVTVPASVKEIKDYAFSGCDELENVVYNGNQKDIKFGVYSFSGAFFLHPDFSDAYKKGIYFKNLNEIKLTGNFADDMVAIGTSQVGYHQGNDESEMHGYNKLGGEYYSEYNYYTGSPDWQWGMKDFVKQSDYPYGYGGWCGNFCDWCMSMAGLPKECSSFYGNRDQSVKWKDTVYAGGNYELKKGDIMHMSAGHYCMIVSVTVDGSKVKIKTLNGNPDVSWKTYVLNKSNGKNNESHNYDFDEVFPLDSYAASDVKYYTVTFDPDGGSGGVSEKTVFEGANYGLLPKPVKSGFTFDGWFTEKNGGGKKISAYRNVWLDGNITVYANWKEGAEPDYLDIDTYVSHAPEHSSISEQFARIYLTKDTFSYADVKKKAQKTRIKRMNGKGKMTCKNVTEGAKKKYIKLGNDGRVTIKKGAPRGTYAIHVTVDQYKTVNMTQATVYIKIV